LVALSRTSHSSSEARSAAVVSVVKKGLPVPPASTITRPFSWWRMARRRMKGSQIWCAATADMSRASQPARSRPSMSARPLIMVASMPIWSAVARTVTTSATSRPRRMFPPPTTMASRTPARATSPIWRLIRSMEGRCRPWPSSPRASPLSFRRTER
jgi:hypothetical protein